jgi:dCMP deaminase
MKDITGSKFGKLLVTKQISGNKHGEFIWKCKCQCGKIIALKQQQLSKGFAKSCECDKNSYRYKEIKTFHWKSILSNAAIHHLSVELTPKDAYKIFIAQNRKCVLSGLEIRLAETRQQHKDGMTTASLDRINTSLHYTINNIQWVHKSVNRLKYNLDEENLIALVGNIFFHTLHRNGKPSWDTYYLNMAKLVSVRSLDPSTKHGCVIADENHRLLSIGYNGPIKNINDNQVPLTRPEKYLWISHAEQNAIMFCNGTMKNSIVYVTGRPCAFCTRMLIQKEVSKIIHGNTASLCVNKEDIKASTAMLDAANIPIIECQL